MNYITEPIVSTEAFWPSAAFVGPFTLTHISLTNYILEYCQFKTNLILSTRPSPLEIHQKSDLLLLMLISNASFVIHVKYNTCYRLNSSNQIY